MSDLTTAHGELPRIAISCGEPAGIGPDLVLRIVQRHWPARLAAFADIHLLEARASHLGLPVRVLPYDRDRLTEPVEATLEVVHVALRAPSRPGALAVENAAYVIAALDRAVSACAEGQFDALLTAPIHKGVINDAGIAFTGHTEHIAKLAGGFPVMLLVAGALRVALATTHLPLSMVSAALTDARLESVIRALHEGLTSGFGIARPRILVCGLNPHAGEGGHLGREEIETIAPVIERLKRAGMDLTGPVPADTAFTQERLAHADAVLAMYHDQGLPVLKHTGFGRAVNVTLGIPIIRTSVDHGTALELAGTNRADTGSLETALMLAIDMAARRRSARH